ncbi:MAG: sporulation protein [Methylocystis sp.]|nr:MAG: sporulation protein [Methylocystis sp.]
MRESPVRGPAVDLGEFERRMRGPEPKPAGKADPLSELARLMGENGEADPYGDILPDPRAPRARPQPAAEPWMDQLRGSFEAAPPVSWDPRRQPDQQPAPAPRYQTDAYAQPSGAHQEQAYHDEAYPDQGYEQGYADQQQQYDPAYGGAEGGWSDDSQYLDYGAEEAPESEERGGWRRHLRPWHAIAAISVVALGSIGWGFAHRNGSGASKEIAVINAPEGPVKVKPAADAEQDAPDASSAAVLDRKDATQVKQVVSNSEQAIDPTVAPKAIKLGNGPVDAPHEPPLSGAQPKKVKTVTVRPDGSRVDDAGLPPAVTKSAAPPADPAPSKGGTPRAETKPVTTTAKPKPAKVAAVEPSTEAAPAAATSSGGYAVQFGAANSEEEARTLLKTVAAKYGVKPTFKPAKVGDKTVYRVRVAGVSKDSANAICNKVKAAGGNCFVAGN